MSSGFLKEASTCRIEVACYVAFDDPLIGPSLSSQFVTKTGYGVIGAAVWPESIGMDTEVCLPYRFQNHPKGFLCNPVAYAGNAQWAFPPVRFRDVHVRDHRGYERVA